MLLLEYVDLMVEVADLDAAIQELSLRVFQGKDVHVILDIVNIRMSSIKVIHDLLSLLPVKGGKDSLMVRLP